MKKVIPKKKDAFQVFDSSKISESLLFQSPSLQSLSMSCSNSAKTEVSMGVAKKNIKAGDLLVQDLGHGEGIIPCDSVDNFLIGVALEDAEPGKFVKIFTNGNLKCST